MIINNLLNKVLTPATAGILALATVSSVLVSSAQATNINNIPSSKTTWSDSTSDFWGLFPNSTTASQSSLPLTFDIKAINGSFSSVATGIFASPNPFSFNQLLPQAQFPVSFNFKNPQFISSDPTDPNNNSYIFRYELTLDASGQDVVFNLGTFSAGDYAGKSLKYTIPAVSNGQPAIFEFVRDDDGEIDGYLTSQGHKNGYYTIYEIDPILGTPIEHQLDGSSFQNDLTVTFQDFAALNGGNYQVAAEVKTNDIPEPASVLGLLTIAGLGLGFKTKKKQA